MDKLELVAKKRQARAISSKAGKKAAKVKKPTQKQRRLAKIMIENEASPKPKTQEKMALEAGYNSVTAATQSGRLMSSVGVQKALREWGFTPERVNEVLDRCLTAKDSSWFKGERIESDAPDYKTQLAAVSTLGDFAGVKKLQVEQRNVNINIDGKELVELLGL